MNREPVEIQIEALNMQIETKPSEASTCSFCLS